MSRFFRILLSLMAFGVLIPSLIFAQTGTIKGKVVDANTGDPLPGANVLVQGMEVGAATDVDGNYTISGVPIGTRTVMARFIGYKTQIKTVDVAAGTVTEVNFELQETVLQLDEIVVTGAGVASEKKRLGNTVATINTKALETAPVTNFSQML